MPEQTAVWLLPGFICHAELKTRLARGQRRRAAH
jgi:hypothetical protein